MQLGYNTNGFAFHRLDDALEIMAEIGYSCVALTLDVHHFNPFEISDADVSALKQRLDSLGLSCVIETGARYLLDPRHKHRPTLLDNDATKRVDFLQRSIKLCAELEAECVSYWSGARPENAVNDDELFKRLSEHVMDLEAYATSHAVKLALEPEPDFLVESMADYEKLCGLSGKRHGLTLDIGHLKCVEQDEPEVFVERYAPELLNVQLDDMKYGIHEHLMFGQGQVDFAPVFEALKKIDYQGPACVELSSASRVAVATARESYRFLQPYLT